MVAGGQEDGVVTQATTDVEHFAGEPTEGLQFHQPGLRSMDIPRDAGGFGSAVDNGFSAVEPVETVGGGEGSWARHLHQRTPVVHTSSGVPARIAKLEMLTHPG